jgi:hypothetical protein
MDINDTIEYLFDFRLGIPLLGVQKQYDKIVKLLQTHTAKTFGLYFPYEYDFTLDLKQSVTEIPNEYYLRLSNDIEIEKIKVLSVVEVQDSGFSNLNRVPEVYDMESAILYAQATNIASMTRANWRTFKFLPPNKVRLNGYYDYDFVGVTVKIPHPSIATIPDGLSESFYNLAELDIKIFLYNQLKYVDHLEVPDGTIELHLDGWENAKQDRDELIKVFRSEGFPNTVGSHSMYYR